MQALVGLSPTFVATLGAVAAVQILLSSLIRITVALVAIMASTADRASRAERVLHVLVRKPRGDIRPGRRISHRSRR
jgi:hypothetical protein